MMMEAAGQLRKMMMSLLMFPVADGGWCDQMCDGKRSPFVGDIEGNTV